MTCEHTVEQPEIDRATSPVSELTEPAREALRQLLGVAPDEDLEEALIPYELKEISLEPDGPPYTARQWYLVKRFHADDPVLIARLSPRRPALRAAGLMPAK